MQTSSWEKTFADFKTTYGNLLKNRERPLHLQRKLYIILAGEHAKVDYAYRSDGFLYVHMLMWDRKIIARRTDVENSDRYWALLNNVLGKRPMECVYDKPEDDDYVDFELMRAFLVIGDKGEKWVRENGINGLRTHKVVWTTTTDSGTVTSIRTVYSLKERERSQESQGGAAGDGAAGVAGAAGAEEPLRKKRNVTVPRPSMEDMFFEAAVDALLGNKATPEENTVHGVCSETGELVSMPYRK